MNQSQGRFCQLYRPVGALLLLLAIAFLLLRSCYAPTRVTAVPTVAPSVAPTMASTAAPTAEPTVAQATAPTTAPTAAETIAPTAAPTTAPSLAPTVAETAAPTTEATTAPTAAPRVAETAAPTAEATVAETAAPTAAPALPQLNLPAAADFTAEGVKLSGTGQPGATVELWDGTTRVGTAVVGADGLWSAIGPLTEGAHTLVVRTVDAAGTILNELPAVDVTVPPTPASPQLNLPAAADFTAQGVKLSGTGQPGATVEVWDGTSKLGTALVWKDGTWNLVGSLAEGAHTLIVRIVDAAGTVLSESPAVDVTVPPAAAQVPAAADDLAASGEAYIVGWGDWLIKLAERFYGDSDLYTLIIDGTNAKAAVDPTFAKITDPDYIQVGQKLWIPAKPAGS